MKKIILTFFILNTFTLLTMGKTSIRPNPSTIGDLVTIKTSIRNTKGLTPTAAIMGRRPSVNLVIVSHSITIEPLRIKQFIQLKPYNVGSFVLPSISIQQSGQSLIISASVLKVESAFGDNASRNFNLDYKSQGVVKLNIWSYIILFTAILSVVAGYIYYRERKLNPQYTMAGSKEPPLEEALQRLSILRQNFESNNIHYREGYFLLSDILKKYLDRSLNIQILEMTSFEIKRILPSRLERNLCAKISQLLDTLDPVKYAKSEPDKNESLGKCSLLHDLLADIEAYLKPTGEGNDL